MEAWATNPCDTAFVQGEHVGQDAALRLGYRQYIRSKQLKKKKRKWVQIKVIFFFFSQTERKLEGLQKPMQVNGTSLKTASPYRKYIKLA